MIRDVPNPPALAEWLLCIAVPRGPFGQALIGDMREEFVTRARRNSTVHARMWYRYQSMRLAIRFGAKKILPFTQRAKHHTGFARAARGGDHMGRMIQDLRYAVRMLFKRPGFSATVVVTLAIGIGATTAIFSVIEGVLLRPLPFPESERLVDVLGRFLPVSGFDFPSFPLSEPEYLDYRNGNQSMESVALYSFLGANVIDGDGDPERIQALAVTANLFSVLRVSPLLGRSLAAGDDVPGANRVVVVSESLWHRRFAGDPAIVGRTISINGRQTEVVGVMPERLAFPSTQTEMWIAYQLDEANPGGRQSHDTYGVARLATGIERSQADAELATMMSQWERDFPDIHTGHFLFLRPMIDGVVGNVRTALLLVFGAVGFVLLIVCANVANLLLARGEHRRREMALRSALGARRGRLLQQIFTENIVLSAVGGLLGLMMAFVGTKTLLAIGASSIPRTGEVSMNVTVLLFTLTLTLLSSVVFGLLPAWQTASAGLREAMHDGGRSSTAGVSRVQFRRLLVIGEMALSVLLVVGAGLTIRSFSRLLQENPGFVSENLLVAQLSLPGGSYTPEEATNFYTQLNTDLNSLSGVQSASAISRLPIMHGRGASDFEIEGRPKPGPGEVALNAPFASPRPGYFETMQIPLLQGRTFEASDHVQGMPVAMINETLAEMFFPGEAPVGKRIRFAGAPERADGWRSIVGVVADVKYQGLSVDHRPIYYFPSLQALQDFPWATRFMAIVVRTDGDPLFVAPSVRSAVASLDATLPIVGLQAMTDLVHQSVAQPRFIMTILVVFAGVALLLGAIGIYGVMAFGVAQRTSEIGLRIALGARTKQVVGMIVSQGMTMAVVGVGIGVAGALVVTRFMESQLFEISSTDPITFISVSMILTLVALVASYLPARRAAKVDPIETLRSD